jgi:dihydrodipicolinate synthase/N-acetylneuraminate lyase
MKKDIGGNPCLIVTPLKEDESVDEESTGKMLDFIAAYKLALYWMGIVKTPTVRKPLVQLDSVMQRELRGALRFIGKL